MTHRCIVWTAVSTEVQAQDDKASLAEQERQSRALAEANGWRVLDVLRVPGHSRRYIDIHDASRDMLAEGIDAFARLLQHWHDADFDILIVRDGNRFARTQTLHAYVTERTITAGARIYSLADGWIDEHNYRMWIAMNGYSAASDIDRLVKASQAPKERLAERGLPPQGPAPWFMRIERTEYGRALTASIDRTYQRLYDDLAALILEGVSWRNMEHELWNRFGHGKNGRAWKKHTMYFAVMRAAWWGHSARNFANTSAPNGQASDLWIFDEDAPLPPGVTIYRHTHDPVWSGEAAERIKAELRRRRHELRGNARKGHIHRFTGLVMCGHCGYIMSHNYGSYQCRSKWQSIDSPSRCTRSRSIPWRLIQDYATDILTRMIDQADPEFFIRPDVQDNPAQRIASIEADIASIEAQTRRLITKQASAPESLHQLYDEQIQGFGEQLRILQASLTAARLEWQHHRADDAQLAFRDLTAYPSLDEFWASGEVRVNQVMHRLMAQRRFVVHNREVVGTARK